MRILVSMMGLPLLEPADDIFLHGVTSLQVRVKQGAMLCLLSTCSPLHKLVCPLLGATTRRALCRDAKCTVALTV